MLQLCPACSTVVERRQEKYFIRTMNLKHFCTIFKECVCCYHFMATDFHVTNSLFKSNKHTHIKMLIMPGKRAMSVTCTCLQGLSCVIWYNLLPSSSGKGFHSGDLLQQGTEPQKHCYIHFFPQVQIATFIFTVYNFPDPLIYVIE